MIGLNSKIQLIVVSSQVIVAGPHVDSVFILIKHGI